MITTCNTLKYAKNLDEPSRVLDYVTAYSFLTGGENISRGRRSLPKFGNSKGNPLADRAAVVMSVYQSRVMVGRWTGIHEEQSALLHSEPPSACVSQAIF